MYKKVDATKSTKGRLILFGVYALGAVLGFSFGIVLIEVLTTMIFDGLVADPWVLGLAVFGALYVILLITVKKDISKTSPAQAQKIVVFLLIPLVISTAAIAVLFLPSIGRLGGTNVGYDGLGFWILATGFLTLCYVAWILAMIIGAIVKKVRRSSRP